MNIKVGWQAGTSALPGSAVAAMSSFIRYALPALLFLTGCGGEDGGGGERLTIQKTLDRGWKSFEQADYLSALDDFEDVIQRDGWQSDAWNGAGWSAGRLPGRLDDALGYFAQSYSLDTTRYDALGGLAFALYQTGAWDSALRKADSLLAPERKPNWRFFHEQTVDFHDARLLIAKCQFNLGDFDACLQSVHYPYLNPDFEADVSTEQGVTELLQELERLSAIHG